ncbi:MAG: nucleotide exchange factor GrpE [Candidatus Portnoybacteria bacterium CG10_big_fil_rev_8_21_14_0_10_44_7]|uniref:Protein GrpE n=1 Tax=Candidatus Portnoybacteria bacterium CG10_big_fil_rev_8_21_14_0_10_44_7 TaxID=1974816 RepID=A0A2M8KIP9_9BACT|nr:MAG: nucleotide exchange factor GrpE [Candidatus Portnoybacteria bacterium CG10_big_fil_rev_8_21_14_0_10_44_7]
MPKKDDPEIKYEPEEEVSILGQNKASKLKKLQQKLKICEQEKSEYLAGWQRAKADLINFRQRQEKQMADWQKMINEGLILEILPVLDTLDAGVQKSQATGKENLILLKKQLMTVLQKHGLEKIDCQNTHFDPGLHEAIECENPPDSKKENQAMEEISCGYKLNGKVIRTSKVKIIKNNNK